MTCRSILCSMDYFIQSKLGDMTVPFHDPLKRAEIEGICLRQCNQII